MPKHDSIRRLLDARVLLMLDADHIVEDAARAAIDAGVGAVEISANANAVDVATVLRAGLDLAVVAGAVTTAAQAWDAVEAGAHALSAAPLDAEIAAVCEAADVAMIAVVSDDAQVAAALALRPDFLRVPSELAAVVTTDTPIIVDLPAMPEHPPGAVLAVSARSLDARSPDELRLRLSTLVGPSTSPP
ncbi:MAG: hypothetical protein M3506_06430 [Chloroflexota bacterium]|nr:hypothetical protein [Chloroflexota bacterium]